MKTIKYDEILDPRLHAKVKRVRRAIGSENERGRSAAKRAQSAERVPQEEDSDAERAGRDKGGDDFE